jgi:hypothetical protein
MVEVETCHSRCPNPIKWSMLLFFAPITAVSDDKEAIKNVNFSDGLSN